jgi:glycosyl transferase, family 25
VGSSVVFPLFSQFERIYIVNLPQRQDRRRQILRQLQSVGLELERGKVEFFPAIGPANAAGFPNVGARGCFLSHLAILELAEKDNLDAVLVIEDDLAFSPQFNTDVVLAMAALKTVEWDMVYLGHGADVNNGVRLIHAAPNFGVMCTHFYGIRRSMRRELVRFLYEVLERQPGSPLGGPMHVDGAVSFFRARHPEFLTVLVHPPLGDQSSSRSDITPAWHDRFASLRPVVSFVRGVLRRYRQIRSRTCTR